MVNEGKINKLAKYYDSDLEIEEGLAVDDMHSLINLLLFTNCRLAMYDARL